MIIVIFGLFGQNAFSQDIEENRNVQIQKNSWVFKNIIGILDSSESYVEFAETPPTKNISSDLIRHGIDEIIYRLNFVKKMSDMETLRSATAYKLKSDRALFDFRRDFLRKIDSCIEVLSGFETIGQPKLKIMKTGLDEISELRSFFLVSEKMNPRAN